MEPLAVKCGDRFDHIVLFFRSSLGWAVLLSLGESCPIALCRILWFYKSPRAILDQVMWSPMALLGLSACSCMVLRS